MDRSVLALGGLLIMAGGVVYLLKDYIIPPGNGPAPTPCSSHTTPSACQAAKCYWYDGKCHSTPSGVTPCTTGIQSCHPGLTGLRQCDSYKNLCECDGNGWNLVAKEDPVCINSIYYFKCFDNLDGKRTCQPHMGYGTDECEGLGLPYGCDCDTSYGCAHAYAICEPTIKECVKQAVGGINISAPKSQCTCNYPGGGKEYCYFQLDDTYFATRISGDFKYKDMFPYLYGLRFEILAGLRGKFTKIWEDYWAWAPPSGTVTIPQTFFTGQGIDTLCFVLKPEVGTPKFVSFNGLIAYP